MSRARVISCKKWQGPWVDPQPTEPREGIARYAFSILGMTTIEGGGGGSMISLSVL